MNRISGKFVSIPPTLMAFAALTGFRENLRETSRSGFNI
jgi:hypothetical protein